jgi:hypothetical protein
MFIFSFAFLLIAYLLDIFFRIYDPLVQRIYVFSYVLELNMNVILIRSAFNALLHM